MSSERDRWHFVDVDFERPLTEPRFVCEAPEGADCRMLPACQHTGACRECEGNHIEECTEADQTPVDTGECVIEPWYMRHAIRMVLEADGIALLDGWEESKGARLEHTIATALGLDIRPIDAWVEGAELLR